MWRPTVNPCSFKHNIHIYAAPRGAGIPSITHLPFFFAVVGREAVLKAAATPVYEKTPHHHCQVRTRVSPP